MRSYAVALGLLVGGLLACKGGKSKPAPCVGQPIKASNPIVVCNVDNAPKLSDVDYHDHGRTLAAGTSIVRLEASGDQPEKIRRRPGVVDVRVCVMTGQYAGQVGYTQNTNIQAGGCQ